MEQEITRILLAEDEEQHATLISRVFEAFPRTYSVTVASTLEQARHCLANERPDVLLADFQLPDGEGTDLLEDSRLAPSFPVVILTSRGHEAVAVKAIKAGALDYVVKSADTFRDLPHIVDRTLREWNHMVSRHAAERQLRTLSLAVQQSPVAVAITDTEGRISYTNPKFEEMSGFTFEELEGDLPPVLDDSLEIDHAGQKALALSAFAGSNWHGVVENRRRDGATYWASTSVNPVLDDGGKTTHFVYVAEDITSEKMVEIERKKLEERLQLMQRMETVGTLAGGIAHDFNNSLAVISLFSEISLMDPDLSDELRERLEAIFRQTKHASSIIQQLLDFSRKSTLEIALIDISSHLADWVKLLRNTFPANITVKLQCPSNGQKLYADATRMQQAVMNLAINARHAMPDGGTLRISLGKERVNSEASRPLPEMIPGDWLVLTVSDTGKGIPMEQLPHVFEPFFTTKQRGEGTGLGLSQVYGIVKQHKGHIDAKSKLGHGTTFTIFLPAAQIENG